MFGNKLGRIAARAVSGRNFFCSRERYEKVLPSEKWGASVDDIGACLTWILPLDCVAKSRKWLKLWTRRNTQPSKASFLNPKYALDVNKIHAFAHHAFVRTDSNVNERIEGHTMAKAAAKKKKVAAKKKPMKKTARKTARKTAKKRARR